MIQRLGIDYRVHTAGEHKNILDPFLPEKPEDVERLRSLQRDVHDVFIGVVKERRAGRLMGLDKELFSGAFWPAAQALELGLIDGIGDVRSRMRELYGDKVRLKLVPLERGGLISRLRGSPGAGEAVAGGLSFADDVVSALEERALWSRYGL